MSELWKKAQVAAEAARLLYQSGDFDGTSNRAYYAMFSAARELLRQRGIAEADAKRHATVWSQFHRHFVATGSLTMPEGQSLTRVGEIRNVADYSDTIVTAIVARSIVATMEQFLTSAEAEMSKLNTESKR